MVITLSACCANDLPYDKDQHSMQGSMQFAQFGSVRIHSYTSPADGWLVGTQIVEGPTQLVIFDSQLLLSYAQEVAAYAASLRKPVTRIILSHGHPDHWSGMQVLTKAFPSARIFALRGVADNLSSHGAKVLEAMRRGFGDKIADKVTIPTEILPEGEETIDGVTYDFKRYVDAESDIQLVALLPQFQVMMAFDLVFPPKYHLFTVGPHFDHWAGIVEELEATPGISTILVGHGGPVDRTAFSATVAYLKRAKGIYDESPDARAYADALKAAFPGREQPGWIEFSSRLLYTRQRS